MVNLRRKNEFLENLLNMHDIQYFTNEMKIKGGDGDNNTNTNNTNINNFKTKIEEILQEYNNKLQNVSPPSDLNENIKNKLIEQVNLFTKKWSSSTTQQKSISSTTQQESISSTPKNICEKTTEIDKPDIHLQIESKMETYLETNG